MFFTSLHPSFAHIGFCSFVSSDNTLTVPSAQLYHHITIIIVLPPCSVKSFCNIPWTLPCFCSHRSLSYRTHVPVYWDCLCVLLNAMDAGDTSITAHRLYVTLLLIHPNHIAQQSSIYFRVSLQSFETILQNLHYSIYYTNLFWSPLPFLTWEFKKSYRCQYYRLYYQVLGYKPWKYS
jgi:hypothetical protein